MIQLDIAQTQLLPNGLRFSPDAGVLLAPPSRLKLDPTQPRTIIIEADLQSLREDIDAWRAARHGILQSGLMEPFKCRWEPGAVEADGSVRPDAKLLVWDGGRRYRVTKDDYAWLPVILDDLSSKEARSAALRTSIHNQAHQPIEQAHAFEMEMCDEGLSLRALAKRYSVDKSYIENRINLLKSPPDVQQFASDNPKLMSHALALRTVENASDRHYLMELAKHKAPVHEIKAEAERIAARRELAAQSQIAPDTESQQRQRVAETHGSAPTSRGALLTTHSDREANEAIARAVAAAYGSLETARQWAERGGKLPQAELRELRQVIDAMLPSA